LTELLELSLAAAICWEILRNFSPWQLPVRLAPVMVAAIAYGLSYVHPKTILLALAAAGGVGLFNWITNAHERTPEVLEISIPRFRRKSESKIPPSRRIPGL
jgi:hypothetical protein